MHAAAPVDDATHTLDADGAILAPRLKSDIDYMTPEDSRKMCEEYSQAKQRLIVIVHERAGLFTHSSTNFSQVQIMPPKKAIKKKEASKKPMRGRKPTKKAAKVSTNKLWNSQSTAISSAKRTLILLEPNDSKRVKLAQPSYFSPNTRRNSLDPHSNPQLHQNDVSIDPSNCTATIPTINPHQQDIDAKSSSSPLSLSSPSLLSRSSLLNRIT
ncbi:hypothetical protein PCASD_23166 [Puccinia coronata f. sp. avenae]|uniref:Uncharacterized protein n=1 Tax=Puccinia coronata f. sp. avenae TaxID=200324 RepID=A0A2N5SLA6_9BASI|nr:hypothetical protein PCASD_23166 [Puccinia coronata f. sp. avenae]